MIVKRVKGNPNVIRFRAESPEEKQMLLDIFKHGIQLKMGFSSKTSKIVKLDLILKEKEKE